MINQKHANANAVPYDASEEPQLVDKRIIALSCVFQVGKD